MKSPTEPIRRLKSPKRLLIASTIAALAAGLGLAAPAGAANPSGSVGGGWRRRTAEILFVLLGLIGPGLRYTHSTNRRKTIVAGPRPQIASRPLPLWSRKNSKPE
jgi:hypothetical protein